MATNSLPQSTFDTFQPISASAVHVLARMAARKAVQDELRSQGVRVSQSQPRSASKHRLICNRILNCIGKRWSVRSVLSSTKSHVADLFGNQITQSRALKRLSFLVQLLRFSGLGAY